jgi:dephospho-CoA kinase
MLERITHPRIGAKVKQHLSALRAQHVSVVVLDAPVMLKAGWQNVCDRIVFVQTDLPIRLRRAATRGWDENELLKRESFQTSLEEKRNCSTDIVDNSGTQEETFSQVETLWQNWNLSPNPTRNPSP